MRTAASVSDYRELARRRLPHFLFEYIDGGSFAESTLTRNVADLADVELRQRVLNDVSAIDTAATLFGERWSMPVALGPVGLAGMNARRGETQAALAARDAGVPFCLSTVSACPLKEVAAATEAPFWFQLYMIRDRALLLDLLQTAQALSCSALVFTVDMPVPGSRYRDLRSGLAGASGVRGASRRLAQALSRPGWTWDVGIRGRPHQLGNVAPTLGGRSGLDDFFAWMKDNFDPTATWRDLEHIRSAWTGPLIVKGILDAEDARQAVAAGADGIVVSNHGGRQLDGVPSTARALPPIVDVVDSAITILVDGGVRSGLDVVRMLALGANGVLLGRPWAYALAAGGRNAVRDMLRTIETELKVAMALTGAVSVDRIDANILVQRARD